MTDGCFIVYFFDYMHNKFMIKNTYEDILVAKRDCDKHKFSFIIKNDSTPSIIHTRNCYFSYNEISKDKNVILDFNVFLFKHLHIISHIFKIYGGFIWRKLIYSCKLS